MKFLFLILTAFLFQNFTFSQNFKQKFLGENFLFYIGSHLIVDSNETAGVDLRDFSFSFYGDLESCQKIYNKNVIYPKRLGTTNIDSLIGRVFVVSDITKRTNEKYKGTSWDSSPIFILQDTVSKEIIYFLYDKGSSYKFPFLTTEKFVLTEKVIPKEFYCNKIKKEEDEFTDELHFYSPEIDGNMTIHKYIRNSKTSYYLSLSTSGSIVAVGKKGVIILFKDGTKINKPSEEIDVDTYGSGSKFKYSAFIRLTKSDLVKLSTKSVKKYRLYIFDSTIGEIDSMKFENYVDCII